MIFIDGTVVNVALPALQSAFHASLADVQWVVESYALFLAALLLIAGSLGDRFGRRKIFSLGLMVFSIASVWCGLAPDIHQLIAARSPQGIGGALLVPGSLSLISASQRAWTRNRDMVWIHFNHRCDRSRDGGMVHGPWLVEVGVFYQSPARGLIALLLTSWKVPESSGGSRSQSFDWVGGLLAATGLGGLVFALIESVPVAGIGGVVLLVLLFYWEAHSLSPMILLSLFQSRNFSGANLLTFFLYAALSGVLFFFPLDLIPVRGYSATQAGATVLPFILLMFLLSSWSGGLIDRYGAKGPLVVGPLIAAVGLALFTKQDRRCLLDHFLSRCDHAWDRHGHQCGPPDYDCNEYCGAKSCGRGFGNQQRRSRVAGVLAVAVFGALLSVVFQRDLDRRLKSPNVLTAARTEIYAQRSRLAAAETEDRAGRQAIEEAFITGYRSVLWVAVGCRAKVRMAETSQGQSDQSARRSREDRR